MDAAERAIALETEGSRLISAATADLDADVPTCPGWQAANLLGHVASGWEAFRIIMESGSVDAPDFGSFASPPEDHGELPEFARSRLALLVPVVQHADAMQEVWSWTGPETLAFYQRRSHLETVVHRVDAELAAGDRTPIPPAVGIDAVDELFTVLLAGVERELPRGSLHLHQTDGDGEFMLQVSAGAISVTHEHAKGDAALRATGEDLLTVMWGRRPLDGLEVFGDRSVAEQWIALSP